MADTKPTLSITALMVSIITLILVAYIAFVPSGDNTGDYSTEKNLAGELADNNLYEASIDEYKIILSDRNLESSTRANINYLIAKIYFENLRDFQSVRIKDKWDFHR